MARYKTQWVQVENEKRFLPDNGCMGAQLQFNQCARVRGRIYYDFNMIMQYTYFNV